MVAVRFKTLQVSLKQGQIPCEEIDYKDALVVAISLLE